MAGLTQRQERAISALLVEPSVTAAAQRCGVGERTLRSWLSDVAFRRAYRDVSRRLLDDTVGRLRAMTSEALEALRNALSAQSESVRVRAALAILDTAVKADADELTARVEALEARANREKGGRCR